MNRWARAIPSALALLALTAAAALAAGPPFPDPENNRAVYDEAGVLRPEVVAELESRIDAVEAATGAEIYVYTQVDPGISEGENLDKAAALMDQWGIGRSGFDDGLVLLVGLDDDRVHGKVSLFGGSGFISQHVDEEALNGIIDSDFVPHAADGDLNTATLDTINAVQERMAPDTIPLTVGRVVNAGLGLIGAPLALLMTIGWAWRKWRREGDDPELTDSPSILMAGPPAEMTPPLATVVVAGRATSHSTNTLLAELAGTGRLAFRNLDQVRGMHSDDEPDPLTDPAIELRGGAADDDQLPLPEREAWDAVKRLAGGSDQLSRERLWKVNSEMGDIRRTLEEEAMRLGWFTQLPSKAIGRATAAGVGIAVMGAGVIGLGVILPMSGAVLFGAALLLGGAGTIGFGQAMSQRSSQGAYVDAMLKAYRRTLQKTMDQARSMGEVIQQPDIAKLADTPDKAVVWGMALGLHDEVAAVLARGLEEQRKATGSPAGAYYPLWLGSTSGSSWSGASAGDLSSGASDGSGSIFSGSAVPDIGGMFDALGSVGSSPPSSASSSSGGGGGSGGGGSSGGGGGSGSF
ncbi:MAG TPA: TPM domain-containing protein [Candidatus Limnocylindrales bacterium]|nr:TPM domain-containing protein [Candidatus Limnocylindrales bacterium]